MSEHGESGRDQAFREIEERLRLYAKRRIERYGGACGPRGGPIEELEVNALVGHAVCCWFEGKPIYDPQTADLFDYLAARIDNRVSALCRPPLAPGPRLSIVPPDEVDVPGTISSDMLSQVQAEPLTDSLIQRDIEHLLNVRQQHLIPLFRVICAGFVASADQARILGITDQSLIANRRAALKKVVASYMAGKYRHKPSRDDKQNKD